MNTGTIAIYDQIQAAIGTLAGHPGWLAKVALAALRENDEEAGAFCAWLVLMDHEAIERRAFGLARPG